MDNTSKEEYNKEPVYYCKDCLSLRIKTVPLVSGLDYCDSCSSTQIEQTTIEEWQRLYKERYGIDYLNNTI